MESEAIINFRTRSANLTPDSPYSAFKSLLECLVGIVRRESLEVPSYIETAEQKDERRVKLNSITEELMRLLVDPDALRAEYRERQRQEQEFNHQ
jgi:hypothetical protein